MKSKLFSLLFASCITCISSCQPNNRIVNLKYQEGGYEYPDKINDIDSTFCFYPLKNILNPQDSFEIAYYGSYLFNSFNEKNLSLRPEKNTTFRLTYGGSSIEIDYPVIIILTNNEVIIKEGISGRAEPWIDEEKLTEKEKDHLNLIRYNYPLDKTITSIKSYYRRKYLDSLILAEP